MDIGNTIRKQLKNLKITQEQMAHQLGVSVPAVNKWENGISYPDITLLAPLARLLKIDINELLEFEEELTDNEITNFINQLSKDIMQNGIETAFDKAVDLIRQYPDVWMPVILTLPISPDCSIIPLFPRAGYLT